MEDLIIAAQNTLTDLQERRKELLRLSAVTPSPGHRPIVKRAELLYEEELELLDTLRIMVDSRDGTGLKW